MTALVCKNISVTAGARHILRGVDLECEDGAVVGVLGPSGAGKSTLFRAIAGETALASGSVVLADVDVTREPLWKRAQRGLAYMPQSPSVLWDLTVRENLDVYARVVGEKNGAVADADAMAERVGLSARLDVRAGALSGGERRRLEFARAIARPPKVMICDEPFAGVDPEGAERVGGLLAGLAKSGVCVLLADHHVAEALAICTRAILLLDGAIAVDATPQVFRDHEIVKGRYLGNWGRSLPPPPA